MKTTPFSKTRKEWEKNPDFHKAYEALDDEFSLSENLITARLKAGLTQAQIAEKMGTTQSTIARLEGGRAPSWKTIQRYAKAVGAKAVMRVEFS